MSLFPDIICKKAFDPWYTGPLLTGSGNNVDKGMVNIQPYLFFNKIYGVYDQDWDFQKRTTIKSINPSLWFQYGLLDWLDFTVVPQAFYNKIKDESSFNWGDTLTLFGIQLLKMKDCTPQPSVRLLLRELFPTGKYQRLNPHKLGTDISGGGSYQSQVGLYMSKVVYWFPCHPIDLRVNFLYTYAAPVHIHGFNAYGGGRSTSGKITPPQTFYTAFSFEYSLTQRWVLASDFNYSYSTRTHFKGKRGVGLTGEEAIVGIKESAQVTIAPALEYNFSSTGGVLAGPWFSVAGKRSAAFVGLMLSLTYAF